MRQLKPAKRIAKNTIALAVGEVASKILSLLLIVYIARYLGDAGLGKYSFALAFTGLFAVMTNAGFDTIIVRDVSRDQTKVNTLISNVIAMRSGLSLITVILIFLAINLLSYPSSTKMVVYLFGLSVIFTSCSGIYGSVFRAFEQMEYAALVLTGERIFTCLLGILVLLLGYGLFQLAAVVLAGSMVSLLLSFTFASYNFVKPKIAFDFGIWKYLLIESLPFMLIGIFVTIYFQIDTVMLEMMKGDAVVGWYNAAYRMTSALGFIPAAFIASVFPMMARSYISAKDSLKKASEKSFKLLLTIALPIAFATTILADKLIWTLYATEFTASIIALKILIWAEVFVFLNSVTGTIMVSTNKQLSITYITAFTAILNVTLNLLLIPYYSYIGASIATVASEFTMFALGVYIVREYFSDFSVFKTGIKPIIASVCMSIFLLYFNHLSLVIVALEGMLIYFLALYGIKGIDAEDIKMVKDIFKMG